MSGRNNNEGTGGIAGDTSGGDTEGTGNGEGTGKNTGDIFGMPGTPGQGGSASNGTGNAQGGTGSGTVNRGRRGRGNAGAGQSEAAKVVLEDPPSREAAPKKVPADLMEVSRTMVWGANILMMQAAPAVVHPDIPPFYLKQVWQFKPDEIDAIAQPVGNLLLKMPAKTRRRLEAVSPVTALITAVAAICGPRIAITQDVLTQAKQFRAAGPISPTMPDLSRDDLRS